MTASNSRDGSVDSINLAEAKARLGELVDRIEAGEEIEITREGRAVARLTAPVAPRKRIDAALLGRLTATMSPETGDAAALVRSMRDGERY